MIFAARLKSARVAAGITQQRLGMLIGLPDEVASTRINRYERAVHDCDLDTAEKLANALGLPLASFYAESEELSKMIAALSALPKDRQIAAAQLLSHLSDSET